MAEEIGSSGDKPVKRKYLNRLTQEQVGKIAAYILPRKEEFTGKQCREIAQDCSKGLGFHITKDNVSAVAGYVGLEVNRPGKGKSNRIDLLFDRLKEQAEAIEQLKTQVKILEETLSAHSHIPTEVKNLVKNDVELASRIELVLKRLNIVVPLKKEF